MSEGFEMFKGVRQSCPLSPSLFDLGIDNIDESWEKSNEGGTVIGGKKIFCLKFADDIAIVSDTKEGLQAMFKDLEKYTERNKMVINVGKTKVMVFRNGGRLKKEEQWKYKGTKIETVNRFKYLGYVFATGNNYVPHLKKVAGKFRTAINSVWGISKRAKIETLSKRLYLMNTIVKAGCLYGSELWGWAKREETEKVHRRFVKMMMGIRKNTPEEKSGKWSQGKKVLR